MLKKTLITLLSIMTLTLNSQTSVDNSIHQFKVADIYGNIFDFSQLKGKKVMIVNTASKCGLTYQYEALQKLYSQYKDLNFVIVGFPSNDFNQELKTDKEIQDFCKLTYAVEFPMMSKSSVVGNKANSVYKILYDRTGEAPMWNFYKYVVAPEAKKINVFPSTVSPESSVFLNTLKPYLNN